MNDTVIRKVSVLRGGAKDEAERQGLDPDDLVIVTTSLHPLPEYHIEKVVGDPVSFILSDLKHNLRYLKDLIDANAEMKIFLEHMFWKEATACIHHSYDSQACETYCNHETVSKEIYQLEVCPNCAYYSLHRKVSEEKVKK